MFLVFAATSSRSASSTDLSFEQFAQDYFKLELGQARQPLREFIKLRAKKREPWSLSQLPSGILGGHTIAGIFDPRAEWDEPLELKTPENVFPNLNFDLPLTHGTQMNFQKNPTLLFVPGFLFDREGHRIGRGKGYYDKYLATHPEVSLTIGLTHSDYVLSEIPKHWVQKHDRKLDCLLTDKYFLDFRRNSWK